MDVLYHLMLRTLAALEQQREHLLEPDLFQLGADVDVQQEGKEVFGPKSDDSIEESSDEAGAKEDDSNAVNQDMNVHARFVWAWEKHKPKLQHEYTMADFALSAASGVWEHAARATGHAWPGSALRA